MEIVVQLRPDLAMALSAPGTSLHSPGAGHADLARLTEALAMLEVDLVPLHPRTQDAQLRNYFVVPCEGLSQDACERIAAILRHDAAISSAYLKPDVQPSLH